MACDNLGLILLEMELSEKLTSPSDRLMFDTAQKCKVKAVSM